MLFPILTHLKTINKEYTETEEVDQQETIEYVKDYNVHEIKNILNAIIVTIL